MRYDWTIPQCGDVHQTDHQPDTHGQPADRAKAGRGVHQRPEQVRSVALGALSNIPGLLANPAPEVYFQELSSTINLAVFYWIDTSQNDPLSARDRGLVNLYAAFQAAGIEILPPMQIVQLTPPGEKG